MSTAIAVVAFCFYSCVSESRTVDSGTMSILNMYVGTALLPGSTAC